MFFPYSSDVFPKYRPWMAYTLFPFFIIAISVLINNDYFPNTGHFDNDRFYGMGFAQQYLGRRFFHISAA